jgi:hypothetical protein
MSFFFFFRCDSCKRKNRDRCYHWDVGDEDSVLQFQEQLREKAQEYFAIHGKQFDAIVA